MIEKIKRACQIANPRLLELSFGSEIEDTIGGRYTITHRHILPNGKHCWGATNGRHGTLVMDDEIKEILGHEPKLNHVLAAVDEGLYRLRDNFNNHAKMFGLVDVNIDYYSLSDVIIQIYDLTKTVKDQSEECLKFLADLL